MIRRHLLAIALAVPAAFAPHLAHAAWPDKPVKVIVPGGAGSGTDTAARLVTEALAKAFGQPFVIDNKPGANGMIGTEAAAKAPNDGYTLLFTYAAAQVVNQSLYAKVNYDGGKDFTAIAQIGAGGNMLVVPNELPVKDLKEFIAYVKSKPANSLSYGSWGNGSGGHLSMEALKQQAGLVMQHVPYKNTAAVNTDLMGGQIPVAFTSMGSALPLVLGGKMKAIAISGPYRVPQLPNVATMTEQGIKFDLVAWYGLFAPAGTPAAIVDALNKEVIRQLKTPEVVERWSKALGLSEMPLKTPEQFQQTVRDDIREWGAIVKAGNIKVD
ncbi:MAG: tripartite tricarboxylate transporter substrate binding protein [Rhodoferax sp.]|nr:tripartite tricarboxylate transporter substrate binding protein [Rhodoferax sp.]